MSDLIVHNEDIVNNTGIILNNPAGVAGTYTLNLNVENSGPTYFIHNFETAVDQPDYVWDMQSPADYMLYYEDTILDADAKFGNYACNVVNNAIVGMYYEPYTPTDEFWPPLTYEFWFNFTPVNSTGFFEIWIFGWKTFPDGGWDYSMYQTWCQLGLEYYEPHTPYSYMEDWIFDSYSNKISDLQYNIPFPLGEYVHCAIIVLSDRIKIFYNGVLFKEYISPQVDGFNTMYTDFYLDNQKGSKLLVDAISITKGEKYTENFTPPTEPPSPSGGGSTKTLSWDSGTPVEITEDATYILSSITNSIEANVDYSELSSESKTDTVRVELAFPDHTGLINITKSGEYLLNSVTINIHETQITGNLYVNNFYCDGPIGENNIVTGNGTEWNLISYADYISISNTTLSDSNASGSTFYAYYSNGNIDGGNNTVWIFEDVMHITDIYPLSGTYGTEIIITGIGFSETPVITFGGVPAVVESATSTQIITHVPIGAITGPITVDDYVSVTPFTVLTPIIENITPLHGPVRTAITITGSNFYTEPVVTFYNGISATITSWNENQIVTSVPFGTTTGPLTVHFDGVLYATATFTLGWSIVCSQGTINVRLTKIYSSDAYGGAMFKSYISNGCFDGGNNTGWIFDGYDPTEHSRKIYDPLAKYQITIVDVTGKSGS